MIRLRDILLELDYGTKLFADDKLDLQHPRAAAWDKFITRIYQPDFEPNTDAEQELLDQLAAYITSGDRSAKLASAMQQLLPLRSRFPHILDPSAGLGRLNDPETPIPWAEPYPDLAWRGTWAPMQWASAVVARGKRVRNISISDQYSLYHVMARTDEQVQATVIEQPGVTYKSAGERMISFSDRASVALRFMRDRLSNFRFKGVPVALGIAKTHPRLIMNPDAMNALGDNLYKESEMLLLTSTFTPDVVVFIDPYGPEYITSNE